MHIHKFSNCLPDVLLPTSWYSVGELVSWIILFQMHALCHSNFFLISVTKKKKKHHSFSLMNKRSKILIYSYIVSIFIGFIPWSRKGSNKTWSLCLHVFLLEKQVNYLLFDHFLWNASLLNSGGCLYCILNHIAIKYLDWNCFRSK